MKRVLSSQPAIQSHSALRISAATWIDAARRMLIEHGIAGLKVDQLALRLNISRGSFYHHFEDRNDLLCQLLHLWEECCQFPPVTICSTKTRVDAREQLDRLNDYLIAGQGYDHQFDTAVREWGRSDRTVDRLVIKSDEQRIAGLEQIFQAIGFGRNEALVRARAYYFQQVGYYASRLHEKSADRRQSQRLCADLLCAQA